VAAWHSQVPFSGWASSFVTIGRRFRLGAYLSGSVWGGRKGASFDCFFPSSCDDMTGTGLNDRFSGRFYETPSGILAPGSLFLTARLWLPGFFFRMAVNWKFDGISGGRQRGARKPGGRRVIREAGNFCQDQGVSFGAVRLAFGVAAQWD